MSRPGEDVEADEQGHEGRHRKLLSIGSCGGHVRARCARSVDRAPSTAGAMASSTNEGSVQTTRGKVIRTGSWRGRRLARPPPSRPGPRRPSDRARAPAASRRARRSPLRPPARDRSVRRAGQLAERVGQRPAAVELELDGGERRTERPAAQRAATSDDGLRRRAAGVDAQHEQLDSVGHRRVDGSASPCRAAACGAGRAAAASTPHASVAGTGPASERRRPRRRRPQRRWSTRRRRLAARGAVGAGRRPGSGRTRPARHRRHDEHRRWPRRACRQRSRRAALTTTPPMIAAIHQRPSEVEDDAGRDAGQHRRGSRAPRGSPVRWQRAGPARRTAPPSAPGPTAVPGPLPATRSSRSATRASKHAGRRGRAVAPVDLRRRHRRAGPDRPHRPPWTDRRARSPRASASERPATERMGRRRGTVGRSRSRGRPRRSPRSTSGRPACSAPPARTTRPRRRRSGRWRPSPRTAGDDPAGAGDGGRTTGTRAGSGRSASAEDGDGDGGDHHRRPRRHARLLVSSATTRPPARSGGDGEPLAADHDLADLDDAARRRRRRGSTWMTTSIERVSCWRTAASGHAGAAWTTSVSSRWRTSRALLAWQVDHEPSWPVLRAWTRASTSGPAHLADDQAVGAQAQRRAHELLERERAAGRRRWPDGPRGGGGGRSPAAARRCPRS